MENITAPLEYVIRVKLPRTSEDEDIAAIFAVKPKGWEVSWHLRDNKKEWPIDGEDFSLVTLYRTYDEKEALAWLVEENSLIKRHLGEVKELSKKIAAYWQY